MVMTNDSKWQMTSKQWQWRWWWRWWRWWKMTANDKWQQNDDDDNDDYHVQRLSLNILKKNQTIWDNEFQKANHNQNVASCKAISCGNKIEILISLMIDIQDLHIIGKEHSAPIHQHLGNIFKHIVSFSSFYNEHHIFFSNWQDLQCFLCLVSQGNHHVSITDLIDFTDYLGTGDMTQCDLVCSRRCRGSWSSGWILPM